MRNLSLAGPSHLSIFVNDPETGRPVQRLPIYAEVAVPKIVPTPSINERFREPMRSALWDIDPASVNDPNVLDRVETAALQAIAETINEESRNELVARPERLRELFRRAFRDALNAAHRSSIRDIPPGDLKPLLAAALHRTGTELGFGITAEVEATGVLWADPLGVLTTDHVGYVSFDLRRLRPDVQIMLGDAIEKRRSNPDADVKLAIWVYPHGHPGRFDALNQARFASDAVVARLAVRWNTLPPALTNMGPRALQNPSLTDWRLSPASFAASPKTLVGENGCEELVPANLALQEFVLRQVVRLTDVPPGFGVPQGVKAAYVDEYKVSWFSLGHSLGEILYSLPLAPGESVKLAVIDWSWDSLIKRDETTRLTEEVLHQTHRDRTIAETVKAGLRELQHGSSFMGGMASAAGASGGVNLGVGGLGAAVGNTWSLGGSTATSEGSRDLAAENVQRLNDSFSQASSARRELNSTVVIQARQEEKESIQTRTFSNYNHSHTLTILYYEVLRHYRVTVEWVRRRPAVLLKLPARLTTLDEATLVKQRILLERSLLDPSLKAGFDALEKRDSIANYQAVQGINPAVPAPAPWWEGNVELELFEIGIWTNDDTINNITIYVVTAEDHARSKKHELHYVYKGSSAAGPNYAAHNVNSGARMETDQEQITFLKLQGQEEHGESRRIPWAKVLGFQFEKWGSTEWRIDALSIRAWDRFGFLVDLTPGKVDVNLFILGREPGPQAFSAIKRPGPLPPAPPPVLSPDKSLSADEAYQLKRLKDHVNAQIDHYASVIQLGTSETHIARLFETVQWASGTMDDYVDPIPLDVFGSYVAYPLAKQLTGIDDTVVVDFAVALNGNDAARRQWALDRLAAMNEVDRQSVLERLPLASAKSERLSTMPTRGVFAEGKLGHCNVSEEIDNTRFWKWEEHPLPVQASEIGAAQPIQPTPQQVAATPTSFPQALVNIVSPTAAPDPVGLGAALSLLGTPNVFRDMSGRQEVADLLKKLSDNTISIAEAANRAREIQSKYGSAGTGTSAAAGAASTGEPKTGLGAPRTSPSDRPSTSNQDLKDLQHVLGSAQERSLITPSDAKEVYTNAVKGAYDPTFTLTAERKPIPSVPITPALDPQLGQAAAVEFFDAMDVDNYFRDVTGQTFAGWFNSTLAGRGSWGPLAMSIDADTLNRFAEIWNVFPPIIGSDRGSGANGITLPEFATLMAKFLHETGSRLQFRGSEAVGGYGHPGLSYAFDSFEIQRPGEAPFTKGSYNTGNGNHTAFSCFHDPIFLAAFGTLAPTAQAVRDRSEWKGTAWPAGIQTSLDASTAFIQEADFYKCRGRGAIQSTGRAAYLPIVDFVRTYSGVDSRITDVQQRWSGLATTFAGQGINLTTNDDFLTASSNADWDTLFATITIQAVAIRGHNNIPGKQYLPMSSSPAVLRGTSRGSAYFVAIAIAGNNPSYGNDVRQRMLEFIGTLWRTPMPTAAAGDTIEL